MSHDKDKSVVPEDTGSNKTDKSIINLDNLSKYELKGSLGWFFGLLSVLIGVITFLVAPKSDNNSSDIESLCKYQIESLDRKLTEKEETIRKYIALHPDLINDSLLINQEMKGLITALITPEND